MFQKSVEKATHLTIRARQNFRAPSVIEDRVLKPLRTHNINPSGLYFGQQHHHITDLFDDPYHSIPLSSLPHYQFLKGNEQAYRDYLQQSWEYHSIKNTEANRNKQVKRFESLLDDIKTNGFKEPIKYVSRPDGGMIIFDGNHRASIANHLDIPLPAMEMSLERFALKNALLSDEFYGIGRHGLPYQSVFKDGEEIVSGRRRDILDRLELVDGKDLTGQSVIDFGSNIGSSSFIAAENGASVVGVEYDPDLVTSAMRINSAFAYSCEFRQVDLSNPVDLDQEFNTGFCFSVDKHVNNDSQLAETIDQHVTDRLYFETHANSEIPQEIKNLFDSVDFLGETGPRGNREFFKMEK